MRSLFNLFFLDLCLLNEKEKDTLATAVDFCVPEGWSLVRSATSFPAIFRMPKKEAFLTNLKTLCVDIFETKTLV